MKRLLITAAVLSLLLPSLVLAADESEKVPHPDYIPFYKNIEQRGNSLFGHKMMTLEEMKVKIAERQAAKKSERDTKKSGMEKQQTAKKAEQGTKKDEKNLEKIPAPAMIKFFEGIRQQGNALWGFVKESWGYGLGILTKDNAACVAVAVGNRDAATKSAISANDQAMLAAFDVRSSCTQTAFGKATLTEIISGLMSCNKDYLVARNEVNKKFVSARDIAWKAFREDLKKCGTTVNPALHEAAPDTQNLLDAIDDQGLDDINEQEDVQGDEQENEQEHQNESAQ
jgi:hypothetical protein